MASAPIDKIWEDGLKAASEFVQTAARPLIFHLSDTLTNSYPFVRELLSIIRPEITIHTGDMADEYKVGRIPEHIPEHRKRVRVLLDCMQELSGQVWVTPGNNDDMTVIDGREKYTVWKNGSRIEVCGISIELNHTPIQATLGVDFALYGHGPTDDPRYPVWDTDESVKYFNGNFYWTIIEPSTKRFLRIPCGNKSSCKRIFVARHGQVVTSAADVNNDLPKNDPPITKLGIRQACYLGEEARRLKFNGRLISSPFTRTLMTAKQVAVATGHEIELEPRFREITYPYMAEFSGRNIEQLRKAFPELSPKTTLPYPWWSVQEETAEDVEERVRPLIDELMNESQDVFIIGHGASTTAANNILLKMSGMELIDRASCYNCSLSIYRVVGKNIQPQRFCSISHMPLSIVTANAKYILNKDESIK